MLSLARINGDQAASYYSRDNYYTEKKGIENSSWWGAGAKKLGLSGKVSAEAFSNILAGKSADGGRKLVDKSSINRNVKERCGLDLTFSASKSVTLVSLKDPRVVKAHRDAVDRALETVEKEFSFVRRGKEKRVDVEGNLTVAQFHHDTSRKAAHNLHPDPQLHTHCVVANMVQTTGKEGEERWLSHFNDGIFGNSKLMGMVYQNELAKNVRALGYETQLNENGTFEIAGFSREQLESFSKRRKQIVALEAKTKKQERAKMLGSRIAKGVEESASALKKRWLSEVGELGLKLPKPRADQSAKIEFEDDICEKAVTSAIKHFSERDVSFRAGKALSFALENHIGQIPSYGKLKEALEDHENTLTYSKNYFGEKNFTTAMAVIRERETLAIVNRGKNRFQPLASVEEAEKIVQTKPNDKKFTRGQEDAFRLVATTADQVVGWQGVAGAGKSYALKDFKLLSQSKGYEVIGLAPDAAAAEALKGGAGLSEARTVAAFLKSGQEESSASQIWLVDEAGKMNAREMHDLLTRASKQKARVVLVGDIRQLSAVEAGNPFKFLQDKGMTTAHLTEHRRQKSAELRSAVDLLANGKIRDGLKVLRKDVVEASRQSTRVKRITEEYLSLNKKERSGTLVLSGTNAERKEILGAIRQGLKSEGSLVGSAEIETLRSYDTTRESARFSHKYAPGHVISPQVDYKKIGMEKNQKYEIKAIKKGQLLVKNSEGRQFSLDPAKYSKHSIYSRESQEVSVGDTLRWTKNDYGKNRLNGGLVKVSSIDGDRIGLVKLKDGKETGREFFLNKDDSHFLDHALVSTAYSSQGKTADRVLLAGDFTIGKESMYVAISRAKHSVKLFVDSYEKMVQRAERSQAKRYALELFDKKKTPVEKNPERERSEHMVMIMRRLKEKKFGKAITLLSSNIKEESDPTRRFQTIANRFIGLSQEDREKTALVAGSREEAKLLKNHVRRALHEQGVLKNLSKAIFLEPTTLGESQKNSIEKGDIFIPSVSSKVLRLNKGSQYTVSSIEKEGLILKSPGGKSLQVKQDQLNGKVYKTYQNSIAEGDQVKWMEPAGDTTGRVTEISDGKVYISLDDGRAVESSLNKPLPLKHTIVQEPFERIGRDKDRVILGCEHTVGSKAFEQALDRANQKVEIFTDSSGKLESRFEWYEKEHDLISERISQTEHSVRQVHQVSRSKQLGQDLEHGY